MIALISIFRFGLYSSLTGYSETLIYQSNCLAVGEFPPKNLCLNEVRFVLKLHRLKVAHIVLQSCQSVSGVNFDLKLFCIDTLVIEKGTWVYHANIDYLPFVDMTAALGIAWTMRRLIVREYFRWHLYL